MKNLIGEAFDAASEGFSADRVIADDVLNGRFVQECRKRGLQSQIVELNLSLLNLRKTGALSGRPRSKRTHFPNEDDYRFAAEIAVRFLERREG
jgi:hypothetical protein